MRKFLSLLIAFSLSIPFYGQNKKVVDSLLQLTESNISDKEKVDIFLKIAFEHVGSDSTGANFYIAKALSIADEINYEIGRVDALYVQGRSSLLSGDYEKSEVYLTKLMQDASRLEYPKGISDAYYGQAWLSYYKGDYDQSIELYSKSLEIRNQLGNQVDIADCLRGLGITYKLRGEFDKALRYLNQAVDIGKEIDDMGGVAIGLNHIGIINSLRGDNPSAMDYYFEAMDILEELQDKSGLSYTLQNIGFIYDRQKDFDRALDYYNRSLKLRQEIGEKRGIAQVINNIGIVYHELKDYDKALAKYQEALNMKEALGDKRGMADGHLNIGRLYSDQGRYSEAISNKKRALEISKETNSDWGRVEAMISLGRSYQDLGQYTMSKRYLVEGIDIAKEAKLVINVREGARLLAIVEEQLGHYKDAYQAQILFQQMSDSIKNEETAKRITLLEAQYQFQKEKDSIQFANEKEKLLLDQRIELQQKTQLVTISMVIILIVVIVVLYRYYRLKHVSNKRLSVLNSEIQSRNESLRALNDEKNNLISVVAHDLQNPLSGISGAIDLLDSSKLKEDQVKLKELIQLSASRMSNMISEILDIESIEKGIDNMNMQPFNLSVTVNNVCDQFSKQAADKNIKIDTTIERDVVTLADERFAIQIVENLLSNAVKFSPKNKTIAIRLSKDDNNSILEVKDEGPGLSTDDKKKLFQKFQRLSAKPTGNESSTGLGLSIVKNFVDKMGGRIWCESEEQKGASFFVELPLGDKKA